MALKDHNYEEDDKQAVDVRKDFDCPLCNANNPYDDGIKVGMEIRCFYCGAEFRVELKQDGKWRYREI